MSAGPGRPRLCSDEVLDRVVRMRMAGHSYKEITDRLNALQIRTPGSRRAWGRSHVVRLLHTRGAQVIREQLTSATASAGPPMVRR